MTGMKRLNLMVASTVGTTLEWYDFFVFAACAVLVFNTKFFVTSSPFVATILSLGSFSVGFLARPLGGILFGIGGDRFGRKQMLVVSLLLMGAGTFAIGLLPTYETIGVLAPITLVLLRIVQGIAVGGEATGAILIIAESMPAG
jgi:MFS family permease